MYKAVSIDIFSSNARFTVSSTSTNCGLNVSISIFELIVISESESSDATTENVPSVTSFKSMAFIKNWASPDEI